jgi:carbamoyl-phosphate synthase large subunit
VNALERDAHRQNQNAVQPEPAKNTPVNSILISSAGRKISLLKLFQDAAHSRGWEVIAGDCDPLAPSLYLADDAIRLPGVTSPDYLPALLELVEARNVRLQVPAIDTELLLLAQNSGRLLAAGCRVLGSSAAFVALTRDKWCTAQEFARCGIDTPASWLPGTVKADELPDRVFVKPRDGSGSVHAYSATRDGLDSILSMVPNAIIQEELRGPEITIDALIDFRGTPIHYVPRIRIRTMGGESIQGRTIPDDSLRDWLLSLLVQAAGMGATGVLTIQAFLTERGPVLTEINPRFGGGFLLSHAAGARYPEWILDMLDDRQVAPRLGEYQTELYMSRYYQEHFFNRPVWTPQAG